MRKLGLLFMLVLLVNTPPLTQAQIQPGDIVEMFDGLGFVSPVDIQMPDNLDTMFVVEQGGKIYYIDHDDQKQLFFDITDKVVSGGERGLLGLAFHPDYTNNGLFYVDYTANNPLRTVIARYNATNNGLSADASSESILLEVNQPYSNHNAGSITFGPDGYLYITLGDGGSAGDPHGNGQDTSTLLGSILRIDVNQQNGSKNYTIPGDNPFVGSGTAREEIYAYGLRNPWRISFDTETGYLFAGDVGQNWLEEVDIIEKGKNYGWNTMEGTQCYDADSCDATGMILPILEYNHSVGNAITGGYVDRSPLSIYSGQYFFADYGQGKIWRLPLSNINTGEYYLVEDTSYAISTFGIDNNGRVYFADLYGGKIYSFYQLGEPPGLSSSTSSSTTESYQPSTASKVENTGSTTNNLPWSFLNLFGIIVLGIVFVYRRKR